MGPLPIAVLGARQVPAGLTARADTLSFDQGDNVPLGVREGAAH